MNGKRSDIRSLSSSDIETFFTGHGEKAFRARQVYDWLWKNYCRSFEAMTNVSKEIRRLLDDNFSFPAASIHEEKKSTDGTIKVVFVLHDGSFVEGVLIPTDGRTTACISSQAGCALNCSFCATGKGGFTRNLIFHEIVDQVTLLNERSMNEFGTRLSNIVYMGMGEPLLNYAEVMKSLEKITDVEGFGMSPQRITISSVGIPAMIRQLADDNARFHFALSLHAATNQKRDSIIPINKKHSLEDLTAALKYYHQKTGKRFTIEYILFGKFNDTLADARDLAEFCKSFPVKINLIGYNPVDNSGFQRSETDSFKAFREFLEKRNLVVNVRKSRGKDIAAACGQLAGSFKSSVKIIKDGDKPI
jgi:23S rRNA (adenine2503-C2)-methyltransferase